MAGRELDSSTGFSYSPMMTDLERDPRTGAVAHREAIAIAKAYVADVFADEGISDLTLEEIWYDEGVGDWLVTVGFVYNDPFRSRPKLQRSMTTEYRTVRISGRDGVPKAIRLHDSAA